MCDEKTQSDGRIIITIHAGVYNTHTHTRIYTSRHCVKHQTANGLRGREEGGGRVK